MSLEIKNETVYVIYYDGKPYQRWGRKLVYTTKGSAQSVITTDSKEEARHRYHSDWWELSRKEQQELIDKEKEHFKIVAYSPSEGE